MLPKISVVIPLFNKEKYIGRTINSVLNQTIEDFEILIVDNNSTDNGMDVVSKYKDIRIKCLQQKVKGVSAARNFGITNSTSNLIAFLDADDEWLPQYLENILKLVKKYPEAGAYASSFIKIENDGSIIKSVYKIPNLKNDHFLIKNYIKLMVLSLYPFCTSSIVVKKKVLIENNCFTLGEQYGEDLEMWLKISLNHPIAYCTIFGAIYHRDAESGLTNRQHGKQMHFFPIKIHPDITTARNALINENTPKHLLSDIQEYINLYDIGRAAQYILNKDPVTARKILFECNTKQFRTKRILLIILSGFPPIILNNILKCRLKIMMKISAARNF
jgi:glycosyltransferase involved in cell wall biosynthesis